MTTPKINFKGMRDWTIDNFFGSKLGILLTVFSTIVITYFIVSMVSFLSSAEWEVVNTNRRLLLLGRLPEEDTWRAWPILWLFCSIFCIDQEIKYGCILFHYGAICWGCSHVYFRTFFIFRISVA